MRVFDASGATIYQSPSLEHQLSAAPPAVEPGRITFRTVSGNHDEDVRLAATAIEVQNRRYVVELVQPVTIGERSLTRFGRMLMLVIPLGTGAGQPRRLLAQRTSARAGHANHQRRATHQCHEPVPPVGGAAGAR